MRVLTTGRVLLAPALLAASVAAVLVLPASAGATGVLSATAMHAGGRRRRSSSGPAMRRVPG